MGRKKKYTNEFINEVFNKAVKNAKNKIPVCKTLKELKINSWSFYDNITPQQLKELEEIRALTSNSFLCTYTNKNLSIHDVDLSFDDDM